MININANHPDIIEKFSDIMDDFKEVDITNHHFCIVTKSNNRIKLCLHNGNERIFDVNNLFEYLFLHCNEVINQDFIYELRCLSLQPILSIHMFDVHMRRLIVDYIQKEIDQCCSESLLSYLTMISFDVNPAKASIESLDCYISLCHKLDRLVGKNIIKRYAVLRHSKQNDKKINLEFEITICDEYRAMDITTQCEMTFQHIALFNPVLRVNKNNIRLKLIQNHNVSYEFAIIVSRLNLQEIITDDHKKEILNKFQNPKFKYSKIQKSLLCYIPQNCLDLLIEAIACNSYNLQTLNILCLKNTLNQLLYFDVIKSYEIILSENTTQVHLNYSNQDFCINLSNIREGRNE